ncbi:hypothetical protein [Acetobacter indonesiensis]|uniref:hypothetical protein n=1 Tax=Acetobacter indonesiensis TaxID=104101 RepID=UPI0020A5E7CF|nr:hypothetical protein [Acetobacter indonesiensis]MCP1230430.1 hypothetical protein [Acetobacter indonesiensis]
MKPPASAFPFFLRRARHVYVLCGVLTTLTACHASMNTVTVAPTQSTLFYTYLIAHGMARGSVMSGEQNVAGVLRLANADKNAFLSVLTAERFPKKQNFYAASNALILFLQEIDTNRK